MTPRGPTPARYTAARYFELANEGVLQPEDRVELLEGVIVAMPPHNPRHASGVARVYEALRSVVRDRAVVRSQSPLVPSVFSAPQPDVAVVPGRLSDYDAAHPTTALLVVEVSDSSLAADRLTKAAIYAVARIPEYWIVNLRDDVLEVFRDPDRPTGRYLNVTRIERTGRITPLAFDDAIVAVDDLLPRR
jgi:Uma2 family endonuclease